VEPQARNIGYRAIRLSSWLLGVDVANAWDRYWGYHRHALLHLVAKLSHVGVDVDELACRLHRSMNYT
jgi:hypothetical protein